MRTMSEHAENTGESRSPRQAAREESARRAENVSAAGAPAEEAHEDFSRDFPAAVAAEGGHPEVEKSVTDRAIIIGRDGKWLAGWALRFILVVIAGIVIWKALSVVWVILLPALLALIVCTVLWPPVKWLRAKRCPAALATVAGMLLGVGVIGGVVAAIAPSVAGQVPQLVEQGRRGAQTLVNWLNDGPLNLQELDIDLDAALDEIFGWLQSQSSTIASGVFSGLSSVTSGLVTLLITVVLTFFFLKDGTKFLPWMRRYTGGNAGWHLTEVLSRSWNTLAGFVRAQALVSFVDALFIGIGLLILQIPMALALAVITFLAGFIPIVGALVAGALAVVIALVTHGVVTALIVLLLIVVVQQIEGNVLQPIIQSKAMNLHAAIVLLAVTLGSTLFGIIGAFLAVPIAAVLAVWLRYHSEMVALRAGEITIDDIHIATSESESMTAQDGLKAVRTHLKGLGKRQAKGGATGYSKADLKD